MENGDAVLPTLLDRPEVGVIDVFLTLLRILSLPSYFLFDDLLMGNEVFSLYHEGRFTLPVGSKQDHLCNVICPAFISQNAEVSWYHLISTCVLLEKSCGPY